MVKRENKQVSPSFSGHKDYHNSLAGHSASDYGLEAGSYEHFRQDGYNLYKESENQYDDYSGRNGDYDNRNYNDRYYYNPGGSYENNFNDDRNGRADYDHTDHPEHRQDYFDNLCQNGYYGNYPAYGRSWADARNCYEDVNKRNDHYWQGYEMQNRYAGPEREYFRTDPGMDSVETWQDKDRHGERDQGYYRPNIRY